MVASASYEGTIDRRRKRIAELESDIERYSSQIRRLKSRSSANATAAASATAAAAVAAAAAASAITPPTPKPSGPVVAPVTPGSEDERTGKTRYWTEMEHNQFLYAGRLFGAKNYVAISQYVGTRTPKQVRTHAQKYQMKLEREARKRRAHAAAIAAAGSSTSAIVAATNAAAAASVFKDESATAAIMAAVASSYPHNAYLTAAAAAQQQHAQHHPQMYLSPIPMHPVAPQAVANMPPATTAPVTTTSISSIPTASSDELFNIATVPGNVENEDDSNGLQYLRDSACSPVSVDSTLDSHHHEAPKRNSSVGNLADYDEFMRKVTKNTFADADLDNMLTTPVKTEKFAALEDL